MTRRRDALRALLLASFLLAAPGSSAGLDDLDAFLAAYRAAAPGQRQALARDFLARRQQVGGFPIVGDDGRVAFVFLGDGDEDEVRLVGDFRTRSPTNVYWDSRGEPMARVAPGAPLFAGRLAAEPDARLDYAFVVDGELVPDPLNPRRIFSGTGGGEVSELVMPGYRVDPALLPGPAVEAGTLHAIEEPWVTAPIRVYLPPGYDPASSYPALYTADGSAWIQHLGLPAVLDRLIAEGRVEPLVAVMIDPPWERRVSYFHDPALVDYLARVVEHVDGRFATRRDPRHRVHAGTSAGGRVGIVAAIERPDLFGRVAALSPALHGPLSFWAPLVGGETALPPGLEVWMSAGTYEAVLARDVATLAAALRRRGVPVTTLVTHEGHSFGAWRNLVPAMLRHLFPPDGRPAAEATAGEAPAAPAAAPASAPESEVLALAESVLAAARDLDAARFAGHFSAEPGFVYLINERRRFESADELRTAFTAMLGRQAAFDVRWTDRAVTLTAPNVGVFTGTFETRARRVDGEEWEASGVVTFVAVRKDSGWRVLSWHTSE